MGKVTTFQLKEKPASFTEAGLTTFAYLLTVPYQECGLPWCRKLGRCPVPCDDQSQKPLRFLRIHASLCTLRSKRHLYMSLPYVPSPIDAPGVESPRRSDKRLPLHTPKFALICPIVAFYLPDLSVNRPSITLRLSTRDPRVIIRAILIDVHRKR